MNTATKTHVMTVLTAGIASLALTLQACGSKPATPASDVPMAATGATTAPPIPTQSASEGAANIDDLTVTANVTTALLRDELLKPYSISVVTTKGDVRLSGTLSTQAQVNQAIAGRALGGRNACHP